MSDEAGTLVPAAGLAWSATHEDRPRTETFRKRSDEEGFLRALNAALQDASLPLPAGEGLEAYPLIYVVGPPRSGTTLLSQLIVSALPVGYIDNLAARFWLRPAVGIRLSLGLQPLAQRTLELRSVHGVSPDVFGPHEFGYFWTHWLKLKEARTHHLDAQELGRLDHHGLATVLLEEIIGSFRSPVVFKNVICGFQAALLSGIHPRSLFVQINRDDRATVASILQSRLERYGSYDAWWSVKPSTWPFPDCSGDPVSQVVRQLRDCRAELAAELASSGVHAVSVSYEDLCESPMEVMGRICSAVTTLGYPLEPCRQDLAPLRPSSGPKLPDFLEARLMECLMSCGSPSVRERE